MSNAEAPVSESSIVNTASPKATEILLDAYFTEESLLHHSNIKTYASSEELLEDVVEAFCRQLFTERFSKEFKAGDYQGPDYWVDNVKVELTDLETKTSSEDSLIM